MALIVDVSIHGKFNFAAFNDVVTQDNKMDLTQTSSGFIETTGDNVDKINAVRGRPRNPFKAANFKATSAIIRQQSTKMIPGLKEAAKGIYLQTVA